MDDDELDYSDTPRRRTVYRCGGWGSYSGPCGATDCEDCYPGTSFQEEEEEMDKLGVATDDSKVKMASQDKDLCPVCESELVSNTNVPQCPKCGTKPFEKKEHPAKCGCRACSGSF